MSFSSNRLPGKSVNLKNFAEEASAQKTINQVNVVKKDEDFNSTSFQQEILSENTPSWFEICKGRNFKIGGVAGAMTSTFVYCMGFAFTEKPWVGPLLAIIPAATGLGISNIALNPEHRNVFAAFGISAAATALGDTLSSALGLEAYPLVGPILVFNIVTMGFVATPSLCLGVCEAGKKLVNMSKNCFSLWHHPAGESDKNENKISNNNVSNNSNNSETTPLNEVDVEWRNSFSSLRF